MLCPERVRPPGGGSAGGHHAGSITPEEVEASDADTSTQDRRTRMTLTVFRKGLMITRAVMTDSTQDLPGVGTVTVVTRARYSMFDKSLDVEPPPEALSAP